MSSSNDQMLDVHRAIKALDEELISMGESITLYICGGAALIFLGHSGRKTEDIDLIHTELSPELEVAAARVASKFGYNSSWLNNDVHDLGRRLGRGWKKKCSVVYQGEGLILLSISRQDLINSKFHAVVNRKGADIEDLFFLKPDLHELEDARDYATAQGKDDGISTYEVWVRYWFDDIKKELSL